MTFSNKTHGEWSKVAKTVMVPMSYEDKEDVVFTNNNNNKYNDVVKNSESDELTQENLFGKDVEDKMKVNPKNALNAKVVHAMKNLQALYDEDTNKIVEH